MQIIVRKKDAGIGFARFNRISYLDCDGNVRSKFKMDEQIIFQIEILTTEKIASLRILILIRNESQQDNIISIEHDACDFGILGGKKLI